MSMINEEHYIALCVSRDACKSCGDFLPNLICTLTPPVLLQLCWHFVLFHRLFKAVVLYSAAKPFKHIWKQLRTFAKSIDTHLCSVFLWTHSAKQIQRHDNSCKSMNPTLCTLYLLCLTNTEGDLGKYFMPHQVQLISYEETVNRFYLGLQVMGLIIMVS